MAGNEKREPSDAALLAAVGQLWQQVDPPPDDLAAGALARIAAEDLEFDLLTLVATDGELAGVRHVAPEDLDATGAWMLEYEGPDVRVYVRLNRIEDRTRVDGWVVPVRALTVQLGTEGQDEALETTTDEFGRFEFASAKPGLSRLTFTDVSPEAARPRVTPPFWI
jgi:hypothetical protein